MIKLRHVIISLILGLAIFGLFQIKFKVQHLNAEMKELRKQLSSENELVHVLKAEWAYLNQPDRLQRLSKKFLEVGEIKSDQIIIPVPGSIMMVQARESSIKKELVGETALIQVTYKKDVASSKPKFKKWRYKQRPDLKFNSKKTEKKQDTGYKK